MDVLFDAEMPPKYKTDCLQKWFDIAVKEESGEVEPREQHERAIDAMAIAINQWSFYDDVDDNIFTSLVRFVEIHTHPRVLDLGRTAEHITDEDLRFMFMLRRFISNTEDNLELFKVRNERDLELIKWFRDEAHKSKYLQIDHNIINQSISDYESRLKLLSEKRLAEVALNERLRA